jgi:hypothetical protein
MRHHQETHDVKAHLSAFGNVLRGDVGFGTVRRDANRIDTAVTCHLHVFNGSDTRQ